MKKIRIAPLLLIMVFIACENKKKSVDDFDTIKNVVSYDSVYSDREDPFGRITYIEIFDNILISKHTNDTHGFSFIDMNSGKLLKRWGTRGQAPNEYGQLGTGFAVLNAQLYFLDMGLKTINHVKISDILKDSATIKKEFCPFTADFRPRHLNIIDQMKVAVGCFKEGRYGVLDSNNKIVRDTSDYPFHYDEIQGIYRGNVFQSDIKSNNKLRKFALLTYASDIFEIYQISDSNIQRTYLSNFNYIPQIKEQGGNYAVDDSKSIAGLMKMAVSDDLICFNYSSKNLDEANDSGRISNEILCFNWKGEKIIKYILPFDFYNFCVDKNYIYCVRDYKEENIIYRFKL